jgi:murein DD-endopeptidase MepM/ murein hydrolase activator NlpD
MLRCVGARGFEPPTSCTPCKRASRTALRPVGINCDQIIARSARIGNPNLQTHWKDHPDYNVNMDQRYRFRWLYFWFIMVLTACHPLNDNRIIIPTDLNNSPTNSTALQPTDTLTSATIISTLIVEPTISPIPISIVNTATPMPTISGPHLTPTERVDPQEFEICSPLDGESIITLQEIVSDPYHPPPPGRDERHHGVDFGYYRRGNRLTIEGIGVHTILAGYVAAVSDNRLPYGNMMIIETPARELPECVIEQFQIDVDESLYHLYAHLQDPPILELGAIVDCGHVLGRVGMTGYNIVEPHLHLETRIGPAGHTFEGMAFYDTTATQAEMDAYLLWRTSGNFSHFDPMELFSIFLSHDPGYQNIP